MARGYLRPNRAFFRPYVAFMTQGEMGWEDFVGEFSGRWAWSPEDVRRLSERMKGHDVDELATQAVNSAVRVFGPDVAQADVYLCVGLEMSNSFMVMVGGEPAVGVGLEAYGRIFDTTHVRFEDLLHAIPHELCHALRVGENHSSLRRFFEAENPHVPSKACPCASSPSRRTWPWPRPGRRPRRAARASPLLRIRGLPMVRSERGAPPRGVRR